ncbi:hypothetical protein HaLaN_00076 [Haematococcus lacustris]|uniref:Uncharacterized protein n=1 Tax=Haematococcus lacustris TaxID=44745 RepID=A0A699YI24_HAELA|nr:hypothetical protein HaLaN_00076 [Haematococcus lacustris]
MKAADGGYQEAVELLLQAGCPWYALDPLLLPLAWNHTCRSEEDAGQEGVVNQAYLSQPLHYSDDGSKLLDADGL